MKKADMLSTAILPFVITINCAGYCIKNYTLGISKSREIFLFRVLLALPLGPSSVKPTGELFLSRTHLENGPFVPFKIKV